MLDSDAARQQIFAGLIAIICLAGIIILAAASLDAPPVLEGVATLAVGFLLGNAKSNGIAGSKAVEASDALASKVAAKVKEGNP